MVEARQSKKNLVARSCAKHLLTPLRSLWKINICLEVVPDEHTWLHHISIEEPDTLDGFLRNGFLHFRYACGSEYSNVNHRRITAGWVSQLRDGESRLRMRLQGFHESGETRILILPLPTSMKIYPEATICPGDSSDL